MKVPKRARNKKMFIGPSKNPIAFITRGEIQDYVTDEAFQGYYHCWKRLSSGMGLPYGEGWAQYPELFITIMDLFSREMEGLRSGTVH